MFSKLKVGIEGTFYEWGRSTKVQYIVEAMRDIIISKESAKSPESIAAIRGVLGSPKYFNAATPLKYCTDKVMSDCPLPELISDNSWMWKEIQSPGWLHWWLHRGLFHPPNSSLTWQQFMEYLHLLFRIRCLIVARNGWSSFWTLLTHTTTSINTSDAADAPHYLIPGKFNLPVWLFLSRTCLFIWSDHRDNFSAPCRLRRTQFALEWSRVCRSVDFMEGVWGVRASECLSEIITCGVFRMGLGGDQPGHSPGYSTCGNIET